jgi:hypothetical protein
VVHKPDTEPHQLSATERCIRRDLDLPRHIVAEPPADQSKHHALLAAFYERRARYPIGQETIEGLQANIVAYSLHAGRWRGLTWHEQQFAIVWLLAGRYHRSGQRDDSYPHFRSLTKQQLLPSEEDYKRVFDREAHHFAKTISRDVTALMSTAHGHAGSIVTARIAGRIAVRVIDLSGDIQVAVRMQLHPGQEQIPAEWLMTVLAAFFPHAAFTDLAWSREISGAQVASDEFVFSLQP